MRTEAVTSSVASNWLKGIAFSLALAACGSASAQTSDAGWRWSIAPYVWGSDVSADVRFPSGQEIGGRLSFDDILDKLDFAALLHLEGHRGEWGMFFDATYLSMSDDTTRGPISVAADTEFGLYELAAVYTPGGAEEPFSVFAGARVVDATLDLEFSVPAPVGPVRRSMDKSFTDFLIGARYVFSFSDRWALNLRGDVGFGDTDQDWGATAQIGWRFGRELEHAVLFGWRHLELDIERDGRQTDVSFDGPLVGVLFGW
jgi:hypothetical protein